MTLRTLDQLAGEKMFTRLNLIASDQGWQASASSDGHSWTVGIGEMPSDAIASLVRQLDYDTPKDDWSDLI